MNRKLLEGITTAAVIYANSMKRKRRTRGGYRANAGRPTDDDAVQLRRVNVMLDPDTISEGSKIGEGNLSLGIRRAVRKARKK